MGRSDLEPKRNSLGLWTSKPSLVDGNWLAFSFIFLSFPLSLLPLLDYAMNQPDVLSQIQPEGEHNTEDQAGPEESEIPPDPSEGKWEKRLSTPCFPVQHLVSRASGF